MDRGPRASRIPQARARCPEDSETTSATGAYRDLLARAASGMGPALDSGTEEAVCF